MSFFSGTGIFLLSWCIISSVLSTDPFVVKTAVDLPLCPAASAIYPCSCYYDVDLGEPDLYCNGITSLEQLMEIFTTATFPTKRFWRIRLSGASLGALPADVFADVQFDEVRLNSCNITGVHPDAFRASMPNMDTLELYSNLLTDDSFPWEILGNYTRLWRVHLHHNLFTRFPDLQSEALEDINLWQNVITRIDRSNLVGAPNLRIIDVSPFIEDVAQDAFLDLTNLEELHLSNNLLGDLTEGSITLNSEAFKYLYLSNNSISTIELNAITGQMSDRLKVFLEENQLTTLPEEVFAPLLDHMVDGWGELDVAGNPLVCDCGLYWLLSNSSRLPNVRTGECDDGTPLQEVNATDWNC